MNGMAAACISGWKDDLMEEFIVLDSTYLDQMASLYQKAFSGDPWNDDWSDPV